MLMLGSSLANLHPQLALFGSMLGHNRKVGPRWVPVAPFRQAVQHFLILLTSFGTVLGPSFWGTFGIDVVKNAISVFDQPPPLWG